MGALAEVIERNGRHEETRTPDLYRVNSEVNNLKPFACLAFPRNTYLKTPQNQHIFGDELVTSFFISLFENGVARVNEFYKKGCQEKSSASTGGEISFLEIQPTEVSLLWRSLADCPCS